MENSLVSLNQPGFKPGDSWLNHLLSITHEIYKSFVCGCEVRFVFLDISKAFGKVFHGSIRFKLEQNAILRKTLWSLFMDGVQLLQGYVATTRRQFTLYH